MSKHKTPTYKLCPRCQGRGSVGNPAFDGMSTSQLYDEMSPDEADEFLREYTKEGGVYDIPCPCCGGRRVATKKEIKSWRADEEYNREVEAEQRQLGMGRY